jgi:hypothetical protein
MTNCSDSAFVNMGFSVKFVLIFGKSVSRTVHYAPLQFPAEIKVYQKTFIWKLELPGCDSQLLDQD